MEGLVSFGNKRTYEDFKKQIPVSLQPLFDSIRNTCMSLGKNVVEDVRMHRIVFGKSLTFRWFADVEPQSDEIIIKIQRDRKESPRIIQIKQGQNTAELEIILKDAYETIR